MQSVSGRSCPSGENQQLVRFQITPAPPPALGLSRLNLTPKRSPEVLLLSGKSMVEANPTVDGVGQLPACTLSNHFAGHSRELHNDHSRTSQPASISGWQELLVVPGTHRPCGCSRQSRQSLPPTFHRYAVFSALHDGAGHLSP